MKTQADPPADSVGEEIRLPSPTGPAARDPTVIWKSKPARPGPLTPATLLVAAIMALGVYLRAKEYFSERSLWVDEAMLSISIVNRGFKGLLQPLEWDQAAPIGFLWLQRLGVVLLGNSERALRLFPFTASLLTLPLFHATAKRMLGVRGAVLALFIFTISPAAILYATEAKQYGFDLLATLVVLHAAAVYVTGKSRPASLIWLAAAGSATLLFSHAVMFVTLSVGLALLGRELMQRRSVSPGLALVGALVFASAVANYVWALRSIIETKGPHPYWDELFLPRPFGSSADPGGFAAAVLGLFDEHLGLASAGLGAAVFVAGLIAFVRRREAVWAWAVAFPLILLATTSLLHIYPFYRRFLVFAVPLLALGVIGGLEGLISSPRRRYAWVGWILVALVVGETGRQTFRSSRFWLPREKQEVRPLLLYAAPRVEPDDLIVLFGAVGPAFDFYTLTVPALEPLRSDRRIWRVGPNSSFISLRRESRVWMFFSHMGGGKRELLHELLEEFDRHGRRIDQRIEPGAWAYLYDFSLQPSQPPASTGPPAGLNP